MYARILNLKDLISRKSLFLLGPRQTGKSTLLRMTFPEARFVDLLEANTFRELSLHPESLRESLKPRDRLIIIDEVQKLPVLLDEAQSMMDKNKSLRFIFTGSSARKLKYGRANLLAGRAWFCRLHPLVSAETNFEKLNRRLNVGSLPAILDSPDATEELKAYVGGYLQEEIRAEGLVRSIESFSRFLEVAALTNGEQLNYTSVGEDAGVPPRTVREHFQVLEDTLIGFQLPAYRKSVKRKPVATAKFYFFDVGVANMLMRRGEIYPGSELYGRALEHLIFLEIKAFLDYHRSDKSLTYWRSESRMEVDFVIADEIAIEVKAAGRVSPKDMKGLLALSEEVRLKKKIVICTERTERVTPDGIRILPIAPFLHDLWEMRIVAP
jgi:predicted AAA+ superfamily ATPase